VTRTDPVRRPSRMSATRTAGLLSLCVGLAFLTGGCVTAGLAAVGPVLTAVQVLVDRSVNRTFPADLSMTEGATIDALSRAGIRLKGVKRESNEWIVEGKGETMSLYATLEPVTARLTRVSVRVEVGSLGADKKTGEEILNQVAISLAPPATARPTLTDEQAASIGDVSALRREIERLGSKLEQQQRDTRATPSSSSAPAAFDNGRVLSVPATAGVRSLPAPQGVNLPARAESLVVERTTIGVEDKGAVAKAPSAEAEADPRASLLRPVGGLSSVETLSSAGSTK
jgi:hypothetical protein